MGIYAYSLHNTGWNFL